MLSDFAQWGMNQAGPIIGEELVTIGAVTLLCVLNSARHGKDFSSGGFETTRSLTAVCRSADMPATSILKKSAVARGVTYRVETIEPNGDFTTITLEQIEKA